LEDQRQLNQMHSIVVDP